MADRTRGTAAEPSAPPPPPPSPPAPSPTSLQAHTAAEEPSTKPPLKCVPHTPQMVVKVRDCPSSQMPIELCYQCFGDPNDGLPPVLLICGLNMQLLAWDESFCEALVRAGFYVIRYDNRDMGHSTKIEHRGRVKAPLLLLPGGAATWLGEKLPYNVEDMAADAWALLDALSIPCAHLFGISMGGMIAQTAALLAPERTISLTSVMSSTNAPDLPQPQMWVKLWMLRKPPRNCTVDELLEFRVNSLRRLLRSALPPDGDYLKKRYLMSLKRSSYSAGLVRQAATIRRAVGRDAALQKLLVPALVVHGAQDVVVPAMHGYRTATMLPYARMLVLKSMGHYFHPAFFPTIIEAFVDMAASTDPAKRGLRSRLPSVSSTQVGKAREGETAEDGNVSAAAAWRRGGGSITSHHVRKRDGEGSNTNGKPDFAEDWKDMKRAEEEEGHHHDDDDDEVDLVDPKTVMMASMGAFIQPVVADASSPVGMAACRSVMVAVPGGNSNPGLPEAVIVENMFLRTPHAVPSVPTPTVVKRPILHSVAATTATSPTTKQLPTDSRPSPAAEGATITAYGGSGQAADKAVCVSPLAAESMRCTVACAAAAAVDGAAMMSLPKLLPMDGATPYVPCSPSRWHKAAPFPQRSALAKEPNGAAKDDNSSNGGGCGDNGKAELTLSSLSSLSRAYPQFHPVVVGVSLHDYLNTHPTERETSGLSMTTSANAAAETVDLGDPSSQTHSSHARLPDTLKAKANEGRRTSLHRHEAHHSNHGSLNEASWMSATAMNDAAPSALQRVDFPQGAEAAVMHMPGLAVTATAVAEAEACDGHSSSSRSSSQERREDESFLQQQAPEEVVEATALPSL